MLLRVISLALIAVTSAAVQPLWSEDQAPSDGGPREAAPRHIALFIGVADYREFEPRGPAGRSDLRGPHNDVAAMRKSLERWKFEDDGNVRVLLDAQADGKGIREGFEWVAERVSGPDDVVVVYFSGHGSWAPDADGDEAALAPGDTHDEGLVPWDAEDINDAEQLVLDDEIRAWLAALRTKNVTLIIDACYSGTLTRSASELTQKGANPPPSMAAAVGAGALEGLSDLGHTLITAAAANQTALEDRMPNGRVHGVLTYHLTQALDAAPPNARYDDVMGRVRRHVASTGADQVPQLEGLATARLFRVQGEVPHEAFATLSPAGHGRWVLDVGALHGVRDSAEYDVFGPGELAFRGEPIARLRVDTVEETRTLAQTIGDGVSIPVGARAVPSRVPMGAGSLARLNVWVAPGAERAGEAVKRLPWASASEREDAHAWVIDSAGVIQVRVDGLAVAALTKPVHPGRAQAVVAGDTVHGYEATRDALCMPLARAFAMEALSRIENPRPPALELEVQFRPTADGRPDRDRVGVDTLHADGDYTLWLRVQSTSAAELPDLYVSAALEGQISPSIVLFPGRPQTQKVAADDLKGWFPLFRAATFSPPYGHEFIRVVVNTRPYSLKPLVNAVPKCGARDPNNPLAALKREVEPIDGWAAVRHPVVIVGGDLR